MKENLAPLFDEAAEGLKEPSPKRLKRSDAFLVESDSDTKARIAEETNEAFLNYYGEKHFDACSGPAAVDVVRSSASPQHGGDLGGAPILDEPQLEESQDLGGAPMPDEPQPEDPQGVVEPDLSEKQTKLEKKRANSRAWHAKWVSKGVPREHPAEADVHVAVQPAPAVQVNMRDVCNRFVTKWIEECGLPASNDRRKLAYAAWKNSAERAALMAGRQGVQV